jgi:hypothetical protein
MIVKPGLAEPWVDMTLPSQMNKLSMSCVLPNPSTTDVRGSLPMRAARTRCA